MHDLMSYDEPPDLPQPPELPRRLPVPAEVLDFPVVPPPQSRFSSIRQVLAATVVATLLCAGVFAQGVEPGDLGWVLGFAALFGLVLAVLYVTFMRQSLHPGVLRIEPEHVRWWDSLQGMDAALPYEKLWVAHKEGRGREEKLVFKDRKTGLIAVRTAFLPEAGTADAILAAVRERISALPDGQERLEGIAAREAVAERIRSGRMLAVPAVAVLLMLVFVVELATGALTDPHRLWTFGANSSFLVRDGELFRLATANLLHGNLLHVVFNLVALVGLGLVLEPLLGTGRFLSVLLVSALAGAAGSAFLGQHALALGASSGIAGLVAAYALILWRWPEQVAHPPTLWTWIGIALAFVWPALLFNSIDHAAHLAGFFAGLVLLYPETRGAKLWELADRRRLGFRIAAALLVALFAAAGWMANRHATDAGHGLRDAAFLVRGSSLSPSMRNHLAWHIVTSPDASRDHLWHALRGIQRAVRSARDTPEFQDTQATAHYRLGQWDEAVLMEQELLTAYRKPFYASQLARFEWAHLQVRGPLFVAEPPPEMLPRAEIVPGPAILLHTGDPQLPPGAIAHFVLANDGKPSALLEVTIGAPTTSGPLRYTLPPDLPVDQAALAYLDPRETDALAEMRWNLQPIVPEAARLP